MPSKNERNSSSRKKQTDKRRDGKEELLELAFHKCLGNTQYYMMVSKRMQKQHHHPTSSSHHHHRHPKTSHRWKPPEKADVGMDVECWTPRYHSVKYFSTVQASRHHHSGNHLMMDDSDGDDDARAFFPCPFCYVDTEVHALCNHLQDEHCFDFKNAVCPLCAGNLGKDANRHFILQHASSLKHRRKSQKSGPWSGSSATLGKELSSFLGPSANGRVNTHESSSDPLLSPFLSTVSHSDPQESKQDEPSNQNASLNSHSNSSKIYSPDEGNALDYEERRQRAIFLQQLIASTIF